MPVAPGVLFFDICFLRDPLQRIQSTYQYFRIKPVAGDPLSDVANASSLGEFVAELLDDTPHRISNVQTNLLANGTVYAEPASGAWMNRALARMYEISFLGVVDRFEQSIEAAHTLLSPIFPRLLPRAPEAVNVSRDPKEGIREKSPTLKEACAPAVYEELVRRNRFDLKLLEEARNEVDRRWKLIRETDLLRHADRLAPQSARS